MPGDEDHDTDPGVEPEFEDPEERPTQPDIARTLCPVCKGEGRVLDIKDWGTQHRAIMRVCTLCRGVKTIDRQQLAAHRASERDKQRT